MKRFNGFSLMEMMVVLLITSIIAAASAPMINKKLVQNSASQSSPWTWVGVNGNAAFNLDGTESVMAMIGTSKAPEGVSNTRLYLDTKGGNSALTIKDTNSKPLNIRTYTNSVYITNKTDKQSNATVLGFQAVGGASDTTAIGYNANVTGNYGVAIGANSVASNYHSTAVGYGSDATWYSTAIGFSAQANIGNCSTALGHTAKALEMYATALGDETEAKKYSTAVGAAAKANTSEGATALGYGAEASGSNAISIGRGAVANGAYDPIAIGAIASGGYSVAIGSTANALGNYSVSIGSDACAHNTSAVAVGDEASAHGNYSSAYGYSAGARADNSTALGYNATAEGLNSVAIGDALAEGGSSIAIGVSSHVGENSSSSIALGAGATVASNAENSVAIGAGATAPCSNVIVLGTANHVVYIPGKLMVDGDSVLGVKSDSKTYLQLDDDGDDYPTLIEGRPVQLVGRNLLMYKGSFLRSLQEFANPPKTETETETKSDRRLKNVGEVFKGGLAELKKIELFHFTFKADEKKIPHVGVMAQDLKKIFPNAVWEGKDGFLRIRWDEMFFALINAVKELDAKIDLLAQKQKKIDELEKRIDKLEKRLNVIEKKL